MQKSLVDANYPIKDHRNLIERQDDFQPRAGNTLDVLYSSNEFARADFSKTFQGTYAKKIDKMSLDERHTLNFEDTAT